MISPLSDNTSFLATFPITYLGDFHWETFSHESSLACLFRFCGGLIKDIKRKAPFFASDFYDALNIQALSAILFIYLATVTNAITFGGLLGDATENMQVSRSFSKQQRCRLPFAGYSQRAVWPPTKLEFWVQLIEVSCVSAESWVAFSAVGGLSFEKLYKSYLKWCLKDGQATEKALAPSIERSSSDLLCVCVLVGSAQST